ncbi:uncharacterized protein LOC131232931 isoform X1 [Magnolia sinica]|uniref:uncharacterized protein LOC131232931 isoform X1 n=1 Tax=Magnolia sinica TaxID=86752 RepID=UPI00265AD5CB|nr:uncharacterized protein LOC131232931 isoform X1 [Magnolia sinica]
MAKFNVTHKHKRTQVAERKRVIHGDPTTGKLKNKSQPLSISGKRKRKLFKKWRREQKEALQKGLVTMQDVEMAVADDIHYGESGTSSEGTNNKTPMKFPMKKGGKIKIKKLKRKGKSSRKASKATTDTPADAADAMVE